MKLDIFWTTKAQNGTKMRPFLRAGGLKSDKFWAKLASEKHQKHVKTKSTSESWNTFYGEATFRKGVFMKRVRRPLIRGRRTCIDNLKMTKNWTQKSRAKRHTRLHQMNSKHALQSSKLATNIAHKIHNLSSSSSKSTLFIKNWLRQNRPPQNRKSAILRPSFAEFRQTCMIRQDWLAKTIHFDTLASPNDLEHARFLPALFILPIGRTTKLPEFALFCQSRHLDNPASLNSEMTSEHWILMFWAAKAVHEIVRLLMRIVCLCEYGAFQANRRVGLISFGISGTGFVKLGQFGVKLVSFLFSQKGTSENHQIIKTSSKSSILS